MQPWDILAVGLMVGAAGLVLIGMAQMGLHRRVDEIEAEFAELAADDARG
jgi:hypothetical protein